MRDSSGGSIEAARGPVVPSHAGIMVTVLAVAAAAAVALAAIGTAEAGHLELATAAHAQQGGPERQGSVQELTGSVATNAGVFYTLSDLRRGRTIQVYVEGTSGNLDPIAGLTDNQISGGDLSTAFLTDVERVKAEGRDPIESLPEIYDKYMLAWDDDSGAGHAAVFEYTIPADGDYQLMVARSPVSDTFGDFRLLVGVDAPQVLTGDVDDTGDVIARLDLVHSQFPSYSQIVVGDLTAQSPTTTLKLRPMRQGDRLSARATAMSGDLIPMLVLLDYSGKPIRSANLSGADKSAILEFQPGEDAKNLELSVSAFRAGDRRTAGEYAVALGINEPAALEGRAVEGARPVLLEPVQVDIGVRLEQITAVDQRLEKFGAVAVLEMEWQDPALAFNPDTCNCDVRVFTNDEFTQYAAKRGLQWPQFTLYNQQGNRWVQNRNVVLQPDGSARYQERFTTDFQAPDLDFRKFPFDTQDLFIRVHSLYPVDFFSYHDEPRLTGIGRKLGEEEWSIVDWDTSTETVDGKSRYILGFVANRQVNYYVFKIFVPILLIILVSWFTFFLRDYGKRVDVAGANLLVFVAFNFTVSDDLPRLGYMTFLDAALMGVFIISAFVVVFNVFLKRLEIDGRRDLAERVDRYSIWVYPLLYAIGVAVAYLVFLR